MPTNMKSATFLLFTALSCWQALVHAQSCTGDNVYFDLQSSDTEASIRLLGHALLQNPGNGINLVVLAEEDLHSVLTGVYSPSAGSLNAALNNVEENDWIALAVHGSAHELFQATAATLIKKYGASPNIDSLSEGQGYVLVSQRKNVTTPLLEVFATFNAGQNKYDPIISRVCAANMLGCPVNGDGITQVLMARSGGEVLLGYNADILIGGHYEWANCEDGGGLCAFILASNLSSRFPEGATTFSDPGEFLAFIEHPSILDTDYLVMAVDTNAAALFQNGDVQTALSRWPATVSSYIQASSYLFIGRAEDAGPIAEYSSTESAVHSLQCLNADTGPSNPPSTPAPTAAPTAPPTAAPTGGLTPTPAPTSPDTDDDLVSIEITIRIEIQGQNLTIEATKEITFQRIILETIALGIQAVGGPVLDVDDFESANLTFSNLEDELQHLKYRTLRSTPARRLHSHHNATQLVGLLRVIASQTAEWFSEIEDAIKLLNDFELVDIYNALGGGNTTVASLESFKVTEATVAPGPSNPDNDDDDGKGKNGDGNNSGSSGDDAASWAASTTGIAVIAVCGAVVVGAVLGGVFLQHRRRQTSNSSFPSAPKPTSDNDHAPTPAAVATSGTAPPNPTAPAMVMEQSKSSE